MQNEKKVPPTLAFYWNQELKGAADDEKMKANESFIIEESKDNFRKKGSVVKWILPVPDEKTGKRFVDENKVIADPASEFVAIELSEAEKLEMDAANGQLNNFYATSNYIEDIF